jgi:hypothetical protein
MTFILAVLLLVAMACSAWCIGRMLMEPDTRWPAATLLLLLLAASVVSDDPHDDRGLASCGFGGMGGVFAGYGAVPGNGVIMGGDGVTDTDVSNPLARGGVTGPKGYRPTGIGRAGRSSRQAGGGGTR